MIELKKFLKKVGKENHIIVAKTYKEFNLEIWKSFNYKNNHILKRDMNDLQLKEIEKIDKIMSQGLAKLDVYGMISASTRYKTLTGYTFCRKCIEAKNCATSYKLRIDIKDSSYFINRQKKCNH